MRTKIHCILLAFMIIPFSGCTVLAVADAVGSAAVGVVKTTAKVTGAVVEGTYNLVTGSDSDDETAKVTNKASEN